MRVRYQPICCGDESKKTNYYRDLLHSNITYFLILLTVITLTSLYIGGVLTFAFEEDFTGYAYPLEIDNIQELVENIDTFESPRQIRSFESAHASFRKVDYDAIVEALNSTLGTRKNSNSSPLGQFKDLDYLIDIEPNCRQQWGPSQLESTLSNKIGQERLTFIIIVKSAINNYARRQAIRGSWYLNQTIGFFMFKTVFIVGACHEQNYIPTSALKLNPKFPWSPGECNGRLLRESINYRDIIQSSGIDSYYNNTIKTFMTLRWLNERCPPDYTLAIDDDYVLEIDNLIKFLQGLANRFGQTDKSDNENLVKLSAAQSMNNETSPNRKRQSDISSADVVSIVRRHTKSEEMVNQSLQIRTSSHASNSIQIQDLLALRRLSKNYLWSGFVRDHVHPLRSLLSKWYITVDEYAFNKYPTYITGGATLMSFKTVKHLYYASYFTRTFKFDDVYVGMIAEKLSLNAIHSDNFMCPVDKYLDANPIRPDSTECMGVHDIEPELLLDLWQRRKNLQRGIISQTS